MKSFFKFLSEARKTTASERAHKLGLEGDGKGNWVDKSGKIVARTEGGKLVFRQGSGRTAADQEVGDEKRGSRVGEPTATTGTPQETTPTGKGSKTITLVFGRFNPPTVGHKKLLDASKSAAGEGDLRIYPSRSVDPKKNPLEPDDKVELMKKMFPDHANDIINDSNVKTIFDALKIADEDGYSDVNIVVGSDRVSEFDSLAQKYNGELYNFDTIETISAGDRDADAEGVSGMSASKMRKAAAENDFETFRSGVPDNVDDDEAKSIMKTVRKAMKLTNESWGLWEIAPKFDMRNLREHYITKKIFKMGDIVENLNTGLVGEIIRRGANHLICVTEEGFMFKSWIKDVKESEVPSKNLRTLVKKAVNRKDNNIDGFVDKEDPNVGPYGAFIPQARNLPKNFKEAYQEVRVERKMRVPGKPNTLVGTGGYFKYVSDMTPGFEKGEKTNLQYGAKPYSGYDQSNIKDFINKYKAKK